MNTGDAQAAALGMEDAAVALAKEAVGTPQLEAACILSGLYSTILSALRRPEGAEERLCAALGVADLQEALMPEHHDLPRPLCI